MSRRRRYWLSLVAAALSLIAVVAWRLLFLPDALDFAGGTRVSLTEYGRGPITGVPVELANADPLTKGRYLAQAADCVACHTAKGGKPFAGGRPFKLPFGTIYAPNITPDRETGIGAWTDAQFLRAVHEGIGPDGSRLYPAFPYASYTMLTDEDVLAIRLYLASLPAVRQSNAQHLRLPIQSALVDGDLGNILQSRDALRAGQGAKPGMEPRRLSG